MTKLSDSQLRWRNITLLVAATTLFLTAPKWLYVGDAVMMRCGSESFIERGSLVVPETVASAYGEPGQFFYRNQSGQHYSKYGWFNSILYTPPLFLEKMVGGEFPQGEQAKSDNRLRVSLLNYYNILLATILGAYLFQAAASYAASGRLNALFVLSILFCTFTWNYLRAHTVEIFQILFFTAAFVHLQIASRCHTREESPVAPKRHGYRHELIGWVFLAMLCWSKSVFVLLLPLAFIIRLLGRRTTRQAVTSGAATTVILAVIFLANWICFDSPFNSGYRQWEKVDVLFQWNLQEGAVGYLLEARKSVPLHFPLLGFSMLFLPLWLRRFPHESQFPIAAFFGMWLVHSAFVMWRGDWCYGPRYLSFAMPVLALPLLLAWREDLRPKLGALRGLLTICLICVSLWSFRNQLYVNTLEFFAPFRAEAVFLGANSEPQPREPFREPYWTINRELMRALRTGKTRLDPNTEGAEARMDALRRVVPLNYAWLE